jgi:ligand-binding sensor domain-containing protein/two-component sensor histidine kinase
VDIRYFFHISLFLILALSSVSSAQKKVKVALVKYGQAEGLPSYNIKQIIKDKKGFLWVASQDGLSRFDGRVFISYGTQTAPKHRLSGPDVRKLIEIPEKDQLWVLPNRDQLTIISTLTGEVTRSIPIPKYSNQDWNITMTPCGRYLWIGSYDGVKILDTKEWRFLPDPVYKTESKPAPGRFEANCIAKDGFNNVWVCYSGYGIVIYDGNTLKTIKTIPLTELNEHLGSGSLRIYDYSQTDDHTILFATAQGLRKITFDRTYSVKTDVGPVTALPVLNYCPLLSIASIKPNEILLSGNGHLYGIDKALGVYRIYDETVGETEGKLINYVQSVYKEGDRIWLACQQGIGIMKMSAGPFQKYYFDEVSGKKLEHLRSILALPDQDILCGQSQGLTLIRHSDERFIELDKQHLYHHMFVDPNHRTLLSRDDGLFVLVKNMIRPITHLYPEFKKYKSGPVNSHALIGDSLIAMGTENDHGILLWNYKNGSIRKIDNLSAPALASNSVNNIFLDRSNRLWVLSDKTITILDRKLRTSSNPVFLSGKRYSKLSLFFDMCESKDSYWIASYGNGIIRLNKASGTVNFLNSNNGLSNDGVYNIFNIRDSALMITTNNGLSVYDLQRHMFKNYYRENGLHSNNFEEVTAMNRRGKIYAGGINGFTVIDPTKLIINKVPPGFYFKSTETKLSNGTVKTNTDLMADSVAIPHNWLQTTVSFAGINFEDPKHVTYRYRIEEISPSWVNNGYLDQISLIGIRPGNYTLEVKASNEDGYWSKPKKLVITIEPKWFETRWFETGIILMVTVIVAMLFRYRIRQIRIQHKIRRDIANDLHDDLGSNLNSIKIFAHLALEGSQKERYLLQLEELVGSTIAGLRDMLWVLEDRHDNATGLVDRINKFTSSLAHARQIHFECNAAENINIRLSKKEKQNFYLIIKEAVNNSFKYADCRKISVSIYQGRSNKIEIRVEDDGKGFDIVEKEDSYGIRNIHYRAAQIGYEAEFRSGAGRGTVLLIAKAVRNSSL